MKVSNGVLALSSTWLIAPSWSFSGFNLVHVKGRGFLGMEFITVGDEVLVRDGTFSRIYSFAQRDPLKFAEYRQIDTSYMDAPLEIRPDRMVFVYSKSNTSLSHLLPASQVNIGDYLVTDTETSPAKVLFIRTVKRYGLYSPLTLSGDILASGIAVSNFMTQSMPFDATYIRQHEIQQAAYAPFRLYCSWKGDCHEETYDMRFDPSKIIRLFNSTAYRPYGRGSLVHRLGRMTFLTVALLCTIAVAIVHQFTASAQKRGMSKGHGRTRPNAIEAVAHQPSRQSWRENNPDACISELVIEQAQTDSVEIVHAKIETEATTPRCGNQKPHTTFAQ